MKKLVLGFSLALSAAGLADEVPFETLVYLPFDSDLESKAYTDRNGTPSVFTAEGGSVTYQTPTSGFVYDGGYGIPGRTANGGYLALDKARVYVPFENFALSNDLDTVTIEFFVRSEAADMSAWQEWLWLSQISGDPSKDTYADREASIFYSQISGTAGLAGLEVRKKWVQNNNKLSNGKWHHVAIVIQPNDEGGSTVTYIIDYGTANAYPKTDKWTGSAGTSGAKLWLALGGRTAVGKMDVDELRITKGALPKEKFLHLVSNPPEEDGDTYVYMPLDENLDSFVWRDGVVTPEISDSVHVFVPSVLDRRICESGNWDVRPRTEANEGCLYANKQRSSVMVYNPWLSNGVAQPLTIEFFVKGSGKEGEMTAWGDKLRLQGGTGFDLLMQGNSDKTYYFRFDGQAAGDGAILTSRIYENDNRWHHFAFTLEPAADGTSTKITGYVDYRIFNQQTTKGLWLGYSPGVKTLSLGSSSDVFWFDEFRISKGALPITKFLRQSIAQKPADGDAVLYLPLDKNYDSTVCPGDNLANSPGVTAFTTAEPWKNAVVEYGNRDMVVRPGNLGSLLREKSSCTISLYSEWLTNGLDAATIEFFMRGSAAAGETTTWGSKFSMYGKKSGFSLLVQADDYKRYYFRVDDDKGESASIIPGIRVDDGKWHHFAFTFAPNANGGTDVKGYVDYSSAISKTLTGRWVGIGCDDYLEFNGTYKDVLWFDEVRISKGVLPKEKFLRQCNNAGLLLIVR